ncbi:MAG: DUF1553 domain-containing protein [Verrucomicrobiota bacterium]|nr:DUF1553 domain-containing protein [Verrucomicrobiota bacterium]
MRLIPYFILCILVSLPAAFGVDYNFDVKTILSDRCFHCHGNDAGKRKAKLRLDTSEGAREVIESGELLARLTSDDPDERMPPADSKLSVSADEIQVIRQWIDEGAVYSKHWSLTAPAGVKVPEFKDGKNPIDAFVGRRLASKGLKLNPEASREKLIRRVAFDLTGLPPGLDDIDTFLKDTEPGAYGRMVDGFLSRPAYGERMASHWLDIARYSDSYGYQVDRDRFVWPWRDWVINAFNENKGYDAFITEQLAGDLLPSATDAQVQATTFNRLHPQKVEGGSTNEEFRVEYVADRVHTFGTAFLGLTLECARCHDHKYDPLTQKEYYQLFSYFQNISESGLYSYFTGSIPTPTMRMMSDDQKAKASDLRRKVEGLEARLVTVPGLADRFEQWLKEKDKLDISGQVLHLDFEGKPGGANAAVDGRVGKAVRLTGDDAVGTKVGNFRRYQPFSVSLWMNTPDVKERAVVFHRSRAWTDAGSRGYQLLIEQGKLSWSLIHFWPGNALRIRLKKELPINEWTHVCVSSDGSSRASGLRIYLNGVEADCEVVRDDLYKAIAGGGGDHITIGQRFRDKGFSNGLVDEFRVFSRELSSAEVRSLHSGAAIEADLAYYKAAVDPEAARIREELGKARGQLAGFEEGLKEIMVMQELSEPKPAYVLERGAYDKRGERVEAGTPAALPGDGGRNRLELAGWLTSPGHPLTARVAVNRFWQMCFAEGLVRTPEDFGSQGSMPTHPGLLDWLARHFIDSGWDMKALLKLIVSSATYRQSSDVPEKKKQLDPENLLLGSYPRLRLPAEMIRDQWLAASGLLSPRVGGAPVKPYEVTQSFKPMGRDKGQGLYRRSVYTFWKRTGPAPVMMALDASKRDVCSVKRERTSTPLQALVLLNDPQLNEAARVLGEKMLVKHGKEKEAMLAEMFRLVTSRKARERELAVLERIYTEQQEHFRGDAAAAQKFLAVGDAKRDSKLAVEDAAAAGVVAVTLFNLWESLAAY